MSQCKNVLIILKPSSSQEIIELLPQLVPWLLRRKLSLSFLEREKLRVKKILPKNFPSFHFINELSISKVDLVITLGGDGTLIGTCRKFTETSPPVFGINMGHLGFITEFSSEDFFKCLDSTLNGKFLTTALSLHKVEIKRKTKTIFKSYFLNDVVVHNGQISRMLKLSVLSNGEHVYDLSGDGLIISSPLGSTAYSMAAGGPIIHPVVKAITLTPVCAHSLTHRPLVVPDDSTVEVVADKGTESICVTLDGQEVITVSPADRIIVTRSKTHNVHIVKNPNRSYFTTLKEKFTHGSREQK